MFYKNILRMNKKENLKNYLFLLETKRKTLFQDLFSFSNTELNEEYIKNKWSINKHLYHLWLAELGTEKYIKKKTFYPETIEKVNLKTKVFHIFFAKIISINFKFKAPKSLSIFPDKIDIRELNKNWSKSRNSFMLLIDEINDNLIEKGIFNHRMIGRINLKMTLEFFNFHYNNHLNSINKLIKLI